MNRDKAMKLLSELDKNGKPKAVCKCTECGIGCSFSGCNHNCDGGVDIISEETGDIVFTDWK